MKERKQYIDVYKGIAIIAVLIGHILIQMSKMEVYSQNYNVLYIIYSLIYLFHMPFFFAILGYLEAYSKNKKLKDVLVKSLISLMIPYIVFSYIMITINIILHNGEFSFWNYLTVFYKPVSNLWFLYALFCFKIIDNLLYKYLKKDSWITALWIVIFMLSFIIPNDLVIGEVVNFGISYHFGMLINRFKLKEIKYNIISAVGIITGSVIYFAFNELVGKTIVGILLFLFLNNIGEKYKVKNRVLEYLGRNTMILFVIDGFTGVPLISALLLCNINNIILVFTMSLAIKLLISCFTIELSKKIKLINYMFYPYSIIKVKNTVL